MVVPSSEISSLSHVSLPNYNFPFKLESDNYILWKSQILPTIIESNMEDFVTGNLQPPPFTITVPSSTERTAAT